MPQSSFLIETAISHLADKAHFDAIKVELIIFVYNFYFSIIIIIVNVALCSLFFLLLIIYICKANLVLGIETRKKSPNL